MTNGTLTGRLLLLWTMSVAALVLAAALLLIYAQRSSDARLQRAEALTSGACAAIRERFVFYMAGSGTATDRPARADLGAIVLLALNQPSAHELPPEVMTGGIWSGDVPLVAAGPGGRRSTRAALPAESQIAPLVQAVRQDDQVARQTFREPGRVLVVAACPLPGPWPDLVAWAASALPPATPFGPLGPGLALLLVLILGMSGWLSWLLAVWTRALRRLEGELAQVGPEALPVMAPLGEPGLDRVVAALNEAGAKLSEARAQSDRLSRQAAASERLAALGRVAAGVAHEIRNPIAAMRLKAENALAGDDTRRRRALETMLEQIARLDHLVVSLLAMTQSRIAHPRRVALRDWLEQVAQTTLSSWAAPGKGPGGARPPRVVVEAVVETAVLDPGLLAVALGNLVLNAAQHTPPGGLIRLAAEPHAGGLRLSVADEGGGVPEALRASLFEPFVSGRADGTGLGLSIASEAVAAHGGTLTLSDKHGAGAVFVIELAEVPS